MGITGDATYPALMATLIRQDNKYWIQLTHDITLLDVASPSLWCFGARSIETIGILRRMLQNILHYFLPGTFKQKITIPIKAFEFLERSNSVSLLLSCELYDLA